MHPAFFPVRRRTAPGIFASVLLPFLSLTTASAQPATEAPPLSTDALRPADIGAEGPVIQLSELKVDSRVKLKRLEDDWRYTRTVSLEILSNADPELTRESIRQLERLEHAMALIFPRLRTLPRQPLTLVLCDSTRRFQSFKHSGKSPAEGEVASLFVHDANRALIVVDLEYYPPNRQRRLYRIYAHYLLSQLGRPLPASLAEGIARVFSLCEIEDDTVTFALLRRAKGRSFDLAANPAHAARIGYPFDTIVHVEAERDELWHSLGHRPVIPFSDLFATTYDSPDFLNPINNPFAIQSLAFVHMCLFGRTQNHREGFLKLVERCARQPLDETLFKECLGLDYAEVEKQLHVYIRAINFNASLPSGAVFPDDMPASFHREMGKAIRNRFSVPSAEKGGPEIVSSKYLAPVIRLARPAEAAPLELTQASYADIARIKADALMLAGHHDEAREELLSAVMRKHADARVFASFGFLARATNEPGVALHYFRRSAREAVDLPGPYIHLAQEKLAVARQHASAGNSPDLTEAHATLRLLYTARRHSIRPRLDLYESLTSAWTTFSLTPTPADLDVLAENLAALENAALTTAVANLFETTGHTAEAAALTQKARAYP